MSPSVVRLSCEQCHQRKTKCDKQIPCSACDSAGITCVAVNRARLPRGSTKKVKNHNKLLEARVARLEKLVKQSEFHDDNKGTASAVDSHHDELNVQQSRTLRPVGVHIARDFWVSLSQEVSGLREVLEESNEDELLTDDIESQCNELRDSPDSTWFFDQAAYSRDDLPQPPPPQMRALLLDIYHHRVDCLFKATHWPSILAAINGQYSGLPEQSSTPSVRALEFAIYFMAVCSLTNSECSRILLLDREELLLHYRRATEIFISRAGLLRNPDLYVLQGLSIYLLALRVCLNYTTSWILLATAVRIAKWLGLPIRDAAGLSTREVEVRRRLWFCIGLLDTQASLDRGSEPLLCAEDFTHPPALVNDSDLSDFTSLRPSRLGQTDMSFSYVAQQAVGFWEILCTPPKGNKSPWDDWNGKFGALVDFEQAIKQHCRRLDDSENAFTRFTRYAADDIVLQMKVLLRRPPYRCKGDPVPPWDNFDILGATAEMLERALFKAEQEDFAVWNWFARIWVKWYALAVLLAELCVPREGDMAERAYEISQKSFRQYQNLIVGTDSNAIWKPIEKLMHRVQQVREGRNHEIGILASQHASKPNPIVSNLSIQKSSPRSRPAHDLLAENGPLSLHSMMLGQSPNKSVMNDQEAHSWRLSGINELGEDLDAEMGLDESSAWFNWDHFLNNVNGPGQPPQSSWF